MAPLHHLSVPAGQSIIRLSRLTPRQFSTACLCLQLRRRGMTSHLFEPVEWYRFNGAYNPGFRFSGIETYRDPTIHSALGLPPPTLVAMREGEKKLHADRAAPFGAHPPSCLEKNSNGARLDRSGLGSLFFFTCLSAQESCLCALDWCGMLSPGQVLVHWATLPDVCRCNAVASCTPCSCIVGLSR